MARPEAPTPSPKAPKTQQYPLVSHRVLTTGEANANAATPKAFDATKRRGQPPTAATTDVTRGPDDARVVVGQGIALDAAATPADSSLRVKVLSQADAQTAGVDGVMFTVSGIGADRVAPRVDHSAWSKAAGAGYASRLRLVRFPDCVGTTPQKEACRRATVVPTTSDGKTLTAKAPAPTDGESVQATSATFAVTSGASGDTGSFAASPLSASGNWAASGATGGFTWSYPVLTPTPATGASVAPQISLGYNSSSVDGRVAVTNNQSSWVGLGWDYDPGFVERSYRTCKDDTSLPAGSQTDDLCWAGDVVSLSMPGGGSAKLVRVGATDEWKAEDDSGIRVTRVTGATNGAQGGEHWRVTTTNGTQYFFGRNGAPGGTAGDVTNSVLTVPVYGAKSTDPCYSSSGFAASRCTQGWRWNLDYVVDTNGNAAVYTYAKDTNYYGPNGSTTGVAYDSAGYLQRIEYGRYLSAGSVYGAPAGYRVDFGTVDRCIGTGCATSTDPLDWPDTPIDLKCASGATCDQHSPSFFSTKQLKTITTSRRDGATSNYLPVDEFTLAQFYPNDGEPSLGLSSISRKAYSSGGATLTLPAVTFGYKQWANRVPGVSAMFSPMLLQRMSSIQNETGQTILVQYNADDGQASRAKPVCTSSTVPTAANLHTNATSCMPVYWTPPYGTDQVLDFFHKYVVTEVSVSDNNAAATQSAARVSTFTYLGDPAWHYDDNELIPATRRTYSQFRGYGTVETRTGNSSAASNGVADAWTLTKTTYYRGMNGDKLPSGNRSVTLTASDTPATTAVDDNAFTGAVFEEHTFDGTSKVSTSITKMDVVATTATRTRGTELPALTAKIAKPFVGKTLTFTPAGASTFLTATTTSVYDTIGRAVRVTEAATNAATRCTGTTYVDNATAWIRDRVSEIIVSAQACPAVGTAQTSVVSHVQTYYDAATSLTASPSKGNPTMARQLLTTTPSAVWSKATTDYDIYGRVKETIAFPDPATTVGQRKTTTVYTPSDTRPTTMVEVTNAKNQVTRQTYDPSRGSVLAATDVGGSVTSAQYDAPGRVTSVWLPGRTQGTDTASRKFTYRLDGINPPAITTDDLVDPGNGAPVAYVTSVKIFNAFGDLRQEQTPTASGSRLVTESFVDSHGWVIRKENGWHTTGAPSTTLISTSGTSIDSRTMVAYDGTGRPTAEHAYQGTTLKWTTRTIYGGDATTVIPPTGGVTTTSLVDGRGKERELIKWIAAPTFTGNTYTGGTSLRTKYVRDALDRVTSHTVAEGATGAATWTSTYDLGGRVTATTDPDVGNGSKTYNGLGEVITTTDARPQSVTTTYDDLGRPLGQYAGATATGNPFASWTYDTYRAGQVATATRRTTAGETFTTSTTAYDTGGRPTQLAYTLAETGFKTSYVYTSTYTSTGQLATRTIPASTDGTRGGVSAETITSWYNSIGQLTGTVGLNSYVSDTTYSPWGEATQYTLGLSTLQAWLTYDRDPHSHRVNHVDFSGLAASPQISDWTYTYDNAGNITKTVDVQGAAGAATQISCYQYDTLQQLKNAWSSSAATSCGTAPTTANIATTIAGPQPFWHSWTLDAYTGRRTQHVRQQVPAGPAAVTTAYNYSYTNGSVSKPRALASTTVAGSAVSTYQYDQVGATTTRVAGGVTATFTYGADARTSTMTTTGTGGGTTTFINDADGNQLLRRDPGGIKTLFLPGLEIKYTTSTDKIAVTRYYSHGGTSVAMRVGIGGVVYVMPNHQGSMTLTYRPSDKVTIRRFLDPYGNKLVADTGTWLTGRSFLDKQVNQAGLIDMGAREYDPTIGRFLSVDPLIDLRNPLQHNGYTYANNNPITFSDPTGLIPAGPDGNKGCKVFVECRPTKDGGWTYPPSSPPPPATTRASDTVAGWQPPYQAPHPDRYFGSEFSWYLPNYDKPPTWATYASLPGATPCAGGESQGECDLGLAVALVLPAAIACTGLPYVCAAAAARAATAAGEEAGVVVGGTTTAAAAAAARNAAKSVDELAEIGFRSDTSHIFRNAAGHLAEDTAENRALIKSALSPANLRATIPIKGGGTLEKYFRELPDGSQAWAEVRNGEITNGGLNVVPR